MAKKIVLGITSPGSGPLIRGQAGYLQDRGYKVYLICPREERSEKFCKAEGCELLPVDIDRQINPLKDILTLIRITFIFMKLRPDVVNVGTPKMGLLGSIGSWLARVPVRVYTCRGLRYEHETGLTRKILRWSEMVCGRMVSKVICISPSVRDKAVDDNLFPSHKVRVIGSGSSNGINLSKFNPATVNEEEIDQLRLQYGVEGKFVFGFVGRLIDRKGINELYSAFTAIHEKHPDTHLILVGPHDDSQLQDDHIIENIEKHPAISWVGWQDNIPAFMSILDVFVMPAWWEGFGNAYLEAAAMGVPVIGTNGTGCVDAINSGFNGVIVPTHNVEELKQAMVTYITEHDLREEHGNNGFKWVENFRQQDIWQGQTSLYDQVAKA